MLRHDNDGEADSKIRYKVLRDVKIQGLNFDSKKSLFDFRLVSKAWGKPSNRYLFTPRRTGEPMGGGIRKKLFACRPTSLKNKHPEKKFRAGFENYESPRTDVDQVLLQN